MLLLDRQRSSMLFTLFADKSVIILPENPLWFLKASSPSLTQFAEIGFLLCVKVQSYWLLFNNGISSFAEKLKFYEGPLNTKYNLPCRIFGTFYPAPCLGTLKKKRQAPDHFREERINLTASSTFWSLWTEPYMACFCSFHAADEVAADQPQSVNFWTRLPDHAG